MTVIYSIIGREYVRVCVVKYLVILEVRYERYEGILMECQNSSSIDRIGCIAWNTPIPEEYDFNIEPKILK